MKTRYLENQIVNINTKSNNSSYVIVPIYKETVGKKTYHYIYNVANKYFMEIKQIKTSKRWYLV